MCVCVWIFVCVYVYVYVYVYMCTYMCAFTYIYTHIYIHICIYVCMCMCVCVHKCVHLHLYIFYVYIYICAKYPIPIFCAIWLRKCDFLTEKLGIKFIPDPDWPDPDPKWFISDPTPDPAKISGSDRIRIHNTAGTEIIRIRGDKQPGSPTLIGGYVFTFAEGGIVIWSSLCVFFVVGKFWNRNTLVPHPGKDSRVIPVRQNIYFMSLCILSDNLMFSVNYM